ncbi:MAG TPA: MFS transporter [Candidatus Methylomirabilis sp.]|nr:MFS transporter [Candidatus Methylomirabilis sp.]
MTRLQRFRSHCRHGASAFAQTLRTNPTLVAVSAEGFLTRLGFSMVGFALPLFGLALGMSVAQVGLLYALRTATTILVKPVMGWAADRTGRKRTLVAAVGLRCVVGLLFAFAARPWHLYVLGILHGTMTAARDPSASALIAEHGDKRSMASAFAWNTTARELGRSLGYAAAGLLLQGTGSYRLIFLIAFGTSCVALVTVIRYVRESREGESTPSGQLACTPPAPRPPLSHRALLPYATFGLMVAGSAEMMRGLFPVIATQYAHLTEGQAGLAASASSIAILVAGPLFAWLSDNVSRKLALGARSFANTFSSLLYIFLPTFWGFLVARTMDDTGKAAFRPTWGAILAEISDADPANRARTISFVDTASSIGEAFGPLAAGLLITGFGVPAMLAVRAALAVVTELQAVRVFKKEGPSPREDDRLLDALTSEGDPIE